MEKKYRYNIGCSGEGYYQGDCKKCWDSEVIETNCKPNGCLENIDKDRVN